MENHTAKTAVFRNDWFLTAFLFTASLLSFVFALGMLVLTLNLAFPLHGYTWDRGISVFQCAIGTFFSLVTGLSLWVQGLKMAHYQARLDDRGVDFRMGTKKYPHETFFAWDQIAAVRHWRVAGSNCYAVVGRDNRVFEFTAYVFFRPRKIANRIAAHIGQPIEEIE
jgi:hypothetical protein